MVCASSPWACAWLVWSCSPSGILDAGQSPLVAAAGSIGIMQAEGAKQVGSTRPGHAMPSQAIPWESHVLRVAPVGGAPWGNIPACDTGTRPMGDGGSGGIHAKRELEMGNGYGGRVVSIALSGSRIVAAAPEGRPEDLIGATF
jgi:hypothetical protein